MASPVSTSNDLLKADELPVQTMSIPNYNDVKSLLFDITEKIVDLTSAMARVVLPRFVTVVEDDPLKLWNFLVSYYIHEDKRYPKLCGTLKSLKKFRNKLTHGKFIGLRDFLTLGSYLNILYLSRDVVPSSSVIGDGSKIAIRLYLNLARILQLEIERKGYRKQINKVMITLHNIVKDDFVKESSSSSSSDSEGTSSSAIPSSDVLSSSFEEDMRRLEETKRIEDAAAESERLEKELNETRALVETKKKEIVKEQQKLVELNTKSTVVIEHSQILVQRPPVFQSRPLLQTPPPPSYPLPPYPHAPYPPSYPPSYSPYAPPPVDQYYDQQYVDPRYVDPRGHAPIAQHVAPPQPSRFDAFIPYRGRFEGFMTIGAFKMIFGNDGGRPAIYRYGINKERVVQEMFKNVPEEEKDVDDAQKSSLDLSKCLILKIEDGESKGKISRITQIGRASCRERVSSPV